jgi:hypothetical protein
VQGLGDKHLLGRRVLDVPILGSRANGLRIRVWEFRVSIFQPVLCEKFSNSLALRIRKRRGGVGSTHAAASQRPLDTSLGDELIDCAQKHTPGAAHVREKDAECSTYLLASVSAC